MAVSNNIVTGRARHSVRAVVGLAKSGAHRVTRPAIAPCANVNMIRYNQLVCGKRLDKPVLRAQIKKMKLEEMQASDIASPSTSWRTIRSELTFLGVTYFITVFLGSMTIAACGPGCCFVFYSVIAGVSGLLMLRKPFVSRCVCLGILILSLFGMWHEKKARDSWQTFHLRQQLDRANELLQKQNTTVTNATNN